MRKLYTIPEFLEYLHLGSPKSEVVHVTFYDEHKGIKQKSEPILIDFYLLAIKVGYDKNVDLGQTPFDTADSFLHFDRPRSTLAWDLTKPMSGYHMLLDSKIFSKHAKEYNFIHYTNHEALFVTTEEEAVLIDLFKKAYLEYRKENFSKEIVISYATLILSYISSFYNRQFETRSKIYNKVVADFYRDLHDYFNLKEKFTALPSVSFFAEKSNLSANYFGDLIKHFTGKSPQEHIHHHIVQLAKGKLREPDLSISEIAYSLGFEYPTYFTRFFKKETGITPTIFREHQ